MNDRQIAIVKIEINLPMNFPKDWTKEDIEFYLNESSYCCDNLIDLLKDYSEKIECLCNITKCKVISKKEF